MVICSSVAHNDRFPERTRIPLLTVDEIKGSLTQLRDTYNPLVRGTRVITHRRVFPSPSGDDLESAIHLQSSPPDVEHQQSSSRKLACDWLTALISHLQKPLSKAVNDLETFEALLDDAAALLAIFAGTASAGKLTRTFTFGHPPTPLVQVQVTDMPLENRDYTTLGAQTWGGACVLAEIIIQNAHSFGLHSEQSSRTTGGLKILELGAGTGLVSLAVHRYLASQGLCATIYATDFNSLVLSNLTHNIATNKLTTPGSRDLEIFSRLLDWSDPDAANPDLFNSVDLVLGADVIYEELHARWIRACLEKFMRKPRPGSVQRPVFHLVIPLRPTHTSESSTIEGAFPLRAETSGQHGWELVVFSKHSILCGASDNETDGQVEYAHYTIGWEYKTSETKTQQYGC